MLRRRPAPFTQRPRGVRVTATNEPCELGCRSGIAEFVYQLENNTANKGIWVVTHLIIVLADLSLSKILSRLSTTAVEFSIAADNGTAIVLSRLS